MYFYQRRELMGNKCHTDKSSPFMMKNENVIESDLHFIHL